jgi:hypothetical protein
MGSLCHCHCGVIGFNGSVNPSSTSAILRKLDANDRNIVDFGAGDGKFLISAAAAGAEQVIGVEYAENIGHKLLFDAVVRRIGRNHNLCGREREGEGRRGEGEGRKEHAQSKRLPGTKQHHPLQLALPVVVPAR